MTFQVFSPSVSSLANGIGAIGTPTRAVDAICPVLTWSHSVVSVSADVFTIPQGYKAVLLHGLYMEPDNVGSNLVIQTRWYSENASAYIGCATNATALTSGGTTLIRAPCAIAMIDASNESVNVTLTLRCLVNSGCTRANSTADGQYVYAGLGRALVVRLDGPAP